METKSRTNRFFNFPVTKIIVGLVIICIAVSAIQFASQFILTLTGFSKEIKSLIVAVLVSTVALITYIYLYKFYEKREIKELSLNRFWQNAVLGSFTGFIILTFVILIMYFGKAYTIVAFHPISFLLPALALAISSAFVEEILFRGVIFRITEERLGTIWALMISSSIFGFAHLANVNSSLFSALSITIEAGILLGAAYIYSGNLWLPIFIHFAWNFSEGGIYGSSISGNELIKSLITCKISGPELLTGGAFGPENSLQAMVLGLIAGLLFLWMAHKQHKFVAPIWQRRQVI